MIPEKHKLKVLFNFNIRRENTFYDALYFQGLFTLPHNCLWYRDLCFDAPGILYLSEYHSFTVPPFR